MEFDRVTWQGRSKEHYDSSLQRYKLKERSTQSDLCDVCATIDFGALWTIDWIADIGETYGPIKVFEFPESWPRMDGSCGFCNMYLYALSITGRDLAALSKQSHSLSVSYFRHRELLELEISSSRGPDRRSNRCLTAQLYPSNAGTAPGELFDRAWLRRKLGDKDEVGMSSSPLPRPESWTAILSK